MDDVKINDIDISNNDTHSNAMENDADLNNKSENMAKRKKPVAAATDDSPPTKRFKIKRRKIKDPNAPKMPLNGYVRYMNSRRESLKLDYPDKTAIELTKIIGLEWTQLPDEKKAPFMAEAEIDRERYIREINEFMKKRPEILAAEMARDRKLKNKNKNKKILTEKLHVNGNSENTNGIDNNSHKKGNNNFKIIPTKEQTISLPLSVNTGSELNGRPNENGVIQVFTDEFLEHNKKFDYELRTLRKSNTDIEMQNSVLEKHIESMKFGLEKMETANCELQEKNRLLEAYLDKLKLKLAQALCGLGIPSEPNGATLDNIGKYMVELHKMATSNSHGPATLNKAKDIIRKLDLHIQL